jgi:Lar family restriction alleviation protein
MNPMNRQYAIREWELFKEQLADEPLPQASGSAFEQHREPCPFCGDRATGFTHADKECVVVWCSNCGASGPTGRNIGPRADNDQVALRRWNTRVPNK